jgi:ABC-type branched-subunit amino acid transport system substrate-binding protein
MTWRTASRAAVGAVAMVVLAAACGNAGSGKSSSTVAPGVTVTTNAANNFSEDVPVSAPGVSSTEIHVGSVVSVTNPVGGDLGNLNKGIDAYFGFVNAKGGLYGRQLKLTSKRDDMTSNNASSAQALLSQDNVYAAFVATELFTGAPVLAKAGIPTFGWNINAEWAGPSNFFPNVAPQCFAGCPLLPHVTPWLAGQAKARRVAVIGYSVPQALSCVNGNVANFAKFGKDVGAQVVYHDGSLSFGQTDFSSQVSQMKAKHVDFLVTCMDFNGDESIAKEMVLQGIKDQVTFYHANLYNPDFVKANAANLEGGIVLAEITAVEHQPAPAGVQEYLDYASKSGLKVTEMTMQGWIAAREFVDALKAAGPHFTWANLIAAWNQQTAYTAGGWIPPVNWTIQHHDPAGGTQYQSPFECANFVKIHNGTFTPVFDAGGAKPWVCWDGHQPNVWSEPINLSFAAKVPATFAQAKTQG